MLIEFKFSNYRSFRDEAILSLEATGLGSLKDCLLSFGNKSVLPGIAIYGKNGGGKSNVIRAFRLAVRFICNAQITQHEQAPVPVSPFLLNDYSADTESAFEFTYVLDGIKYVYGFSATKSAVTRENLYHYPKGQRAKVFERAVQNYSFTYNKARRKLISKAVSNNQLYFSVACTMNDADCSSAMRWFREYVFFSSDYSDMPGRFPEYADIHDMLRTISRYVKELDLGIEGIQFEFDGHIISHLSSLPESTQAGLRTALSNLLFSVNTGMPATPGRIKVSVIHKVQRRDGTSESYALDISDESEGTRKLIALVPAIEYVLQKGGLLLVDGIGNDMHPLIVEYIVSRFQSSENNPNGAQIVFTTNNTELMSEALIRKDQIYFVDKDRNSGASELYSIREFSTKTSENIRKGYLLGKYGAIPEIGED